jgi:hypothetical protein
MAKAGRKASTSARRGKTRRGVLRHLPDLLKSSAIPLSSVLVPLLPDGMEIVWEKEPAPPPASTEAPQPPVKLVKKEIRLRRAFKQHPRWDGESKYAYARRLRELLPVAPGEKPYAVTAIVRYLYARQKRRRS